MENITDVRNALIEVYKDLKAKKIEIEQAKTMVTTANSIIHTALVELDYNKFTGKHTEIEFLKPKPLELSEGVELIKINEKTLK
jgi:hypothetical protein